MGRTPNRLPNYLLTEDITDIELNSEYVIFLDGTYYKAINGDTGKIDYSSTSAHTTIQNAITALTRGVVRLKTDVTLTAGITGKANVVLDCGMHVLTPATSFVMVTMKPGFQLRNFVFNVSAITFTHTCVYFNGADQYDYTASSINLNTMVSNGRGYSAAQSGRFLWMDCDAANEWIGFVTIKDVFTRAFEYAYYLEASFNSALCWVNENVFDRIRGDNDKYFVYQLRVAVGKIDGNEFCGFGYQARTQTATVFTVMGKDNYFQGRVWDVAGGQWACIFDVISEANLFFIQECEVTFFTFAGTYNQVYSMSDHGYTGNSNFNFFKHSGANPVLLVYGDDAGTDKYLAINVSGSGRAEIHPSVGEDLHLYSDTHFYINRAINAPIQCFSAPTTAMNPLFQIFGRNAADSADKYLSLRWGDNTNDMGIIATNNGDLKLEPATDVIRFGTYTGTPATDSTGYITVKDSAGNTRKLMVQA